MTTPFLGEIRLVSFAFAPKGWAFCAGQLLPINQEQALFALLGTFYGGDGVTTFGLPDLRGRAPMHIGSNFPIGAISGEESHTLQQAEMPNHLHVVTARPTASTSSPTNAMWAGSAQTAYSGATNLVAMSPAAIQNAGGSQPHDNMPPFLVLNYVIALSGIFPSRN
jgi:microcystin-dependent protein